MVYFLVQFSKFYSMLFEVRSILVHLRGGPRSSQTTLWGCFPQLFLLSGTFQFPGALLFGPLAKKLGLYLACSSMHFPQLHLCPWTRNGRTERKKKKIVGSLAYPLETTAPLIRGKSLLPQFLRLRMLWSLMPVTPQDCLGSGAQGNGEKENKTRDFSTTSKF